MARCKQTNRARPRSTRKPGSPDAAVDTTAPTITHETIDNTTTDLADQLNTLSFNSQQTLPRRPTASIHKCLAGRIPKAKAPKFLPKYRVGKYTKRVEAGAVGLRKEGNSTGAKDKTTLLYCLDCVRPHLHVYCDGVRELKTTHLCSYHTSNPDPRHTTAYCRRIWEFLTESFVENGTIPSGAVTRPRFLHRTRCGHNKKQPMEEFFPVDLLEDVKMVDDAAPTDTDGDGSAADDELI